MSVDVRAEDHPKNVRFDGATKSKSDDALVVLVVAELKRLGAALTPHCSTQSGDVVVKFYLKTSTTFAELGRSQEFLK